MIVEDHCIFRIGLEALITQEDDLEVCGYAESATNAWKEIPVLKPDMLMVDISLKGKNGLDFVKEIHEYDRDLPILVLSMHDESLYAERAFHAGARGYIMKQETSESVIEAIRSVLEGKIYASEELTINIMSKLLGHSKIGSAPPVHTPVHSLSDRELEVFRLLGEGLTTKEIASRLNLSIKTIGTYRERIKQKLNLRHSAELVRHAVHWAEVSD